ncbi:thrombospondin type 3 repeat-containing protein [Flavivirga aquimarina]|uniref:Thrombospondin type 3 repeat-containing protein n=1 Tax=Flavivirga aquimarina TaxID=2027862 RepID=A0ABT8WFY1_9FLAO|nr:thrombospondin type 3 repeat-containing protein [Flavivirga aquimarina]MDO5971992.1 thrombospondin type 3 repeat-containing protein [Flavivirga aquimarina]
MIHTIRTSKFSKVIASYLAIQLMLTTVQPSQLFALTSGPSQPEFNAFTPIGTSDMVNLSTGDFNYNIPIMDVGGYPLNLAYDSGVTMDQEASWVGLGWNLNVGQINRQVRGIPDDFKGDEMTYKKNLKPNVTVGISAQVDGQIFGFEFEDGVKVPKAGPSVSVGMGINYNNYTGVSFKPSYGLAFDLGDYVNVGVNVQTSAIEGATISPKIGAKAKIGEIKGRNVTGSLNAGISYNSNKGLSSFGLSASKSIAFNKGVKEKSGISYLKADSHGLGGTSGNISFSNFTLTPRKRTAFIDFNSTFSFSTGIDIWGGDGEIEISATAAVQKIKDAIKKEKAYGYEFSGQATKHDVLDYNRENDRTISRNMLSLPYTNYTYDLYSVNGQGISGMFRPHRSQIGQVYDEYVKDESKSFSLGIEAEGGTGWHYGGNFVAAPSKSYTGVWQTRASNTFKNENESTLSSTNLDYEPVYFKYVGENKVDNERSLFTEQLKGDHAMALKIGGTGFYKYANNEFKVKRYQGNTNIPQYSNELFSDNTSFSGQFKRTTRDVRNQSIQKISVAELKNFYEGSYAYERINKHAKEHHTAEIRMLKPDGSTYVFGETAYNIEKQEVTFATESNNYDCATGVVTYEEGENSTGNNAGIDHFYDNVITPEYAHTYLLSSVLSSDYEDRTGNGPTNDDLGAYTLFDYVIPAGEDNPFQWRIPYGNMQASYNAGLNSNRADQKGSYIYGKKEVKYIRKIETKTHVAVFNISPRKDGRGVANENGLEPGSDTQQLYKINTIKLYSKPEYDTYKDELENNDPSDDPSIEELSPIKTAHFIYDYSLCKHIDNNLGGAPDEYELSNDLGKLTLKSVYFTYRNSKMGKHTPYIFNYEKEFVINEGTVDEEIIDNNPDYSLKAFDIWGNYKPNDLGGCNTQDPITTSEYPFVDQESKEIQDVYAAAWSLTSIELPSGGSINMTYESDDYQYVQDRHAQKMFKVAGAGLSNISSDPKSNQYLYVGPYEAKYLYVELPNETDTTFDFKEKYLKNIDDKPVYFRFLMNMTKKGARNTSSRDYDYVTGYFEMDEEVNIFQSSSDNLIYAAVPMKWTPMEGSLNGNNDKNPITKAGLYFGRTYLNGIVYGLNQDHRSENVVTIAKKLVASIGAIGQIFTGPNEKLRSNAHLCAQRFIPEKSWIRLTNPKLYKLGGGSRIKKLEMNDHWNEMATSGTSQNYGQTYDYTLKNQSSSGVATFEPNDSAENPFVEPFYDKGSRLIAPREVSYVEKPFGKAFFPHSKVTYSRVTVKNLDRTDITRHATGSVVSEFYTTKDFPTKVDYTDIDTHYQSNQNNVLEQIIGGLFGFPVNVKNEFTLSQGYVVHTNDMDGRMRMQKVFQEGIDDYISSVEYIYSKKEGNDNILNNKLPVVDKWGAVDEKEIAVDYDLITDFREAYSKSETKGGNVNVVAIPFTLFVLIIPTAFPVLTKNENIAHSIITTKTVHTTAILKEKIAMDLGATVSTVNEAWDAETGQVILTKTINEFDDTYYNFNFPAYWAYGNMGQASKNLGIKGMLSYSGDYFTLPDANSYLTLGDEIMATYGGITKRLWVVEFNESNGVLLMDRDGRVVNRSEALQIGEDINFKIIRSGYRNQQMGNMASITMMKNPIQDTSGNYVASIDTDSFLLDDSTSTANNLRIINASAVGYNDFWNCQCENELPFIPNVNVTSDVLAELPLEAYQFNPYIYNVNGEWRAEKSYAYLTERTDIKLGGTSVKKNTRKEGYFKDFIPFYAYDSIKEEWSVNTNAINIEDENAENISPWTFASEVTQYSPFGAELENKDALDRYSSAQYGYNYTLPTAVASNSKYRSMAVDNFEDYSFFNTTEGHFNFIEDVVNDGDGGIAISTDQSHTGHSSLQVPGTDMATKEVELLGIAADDDFDGDGRPNNEDNCPYTYNPNQGDYDKDEIGDVCDDEAIPKISNLIKTERLNYGCSKQMAFTIDGTPYGKGYLKFIVNERPRGGFVIYLNGDKIGDDGADNPDGKEVEINFDASGKYFGQFELYGQRKSKSYLKTAIELQDSFHNSITKMFLTLTVYKSSGCHGVSYDANKLFNSDVN